MAGSLREAKADAPLPILARQAIPRQAKSVRAAVSPAELTCFGAYRMRSLIEELVTSGFFMTK
jgi:hypothetical protein